MGQERFRSVGALAPLNGWPGEVVLDRERTPPRPVELAQVPPAVVSDGVLLAALLRTSELATRVGHPAVQPVLGLVERDGGLALASAHLEGTPLTAVLAAGGPLPPELAMRVLGQLARALEAVHGLTAAGQRPLVHGAVGPATVRIGPGGEVLLAGLGRPPEGAPAAAAPADDVAALLRLPGLLNPELPAALAAGLGELAGPGATAAAVWRALEAVVAPAEPAKLAVWLERMAPEASAERLARRRALAAALVDEAGDPVDEAAEAAAEAEEVAEVAVPLPVPAAGHDHDAPEQPAPLPAPGLAAPEAVAAAPASAPPGSTRDGPASGPAWFAPPTATASPPPPRATATPASGEPPGRPAPPSLRGARASAAGPQVPAPPPAPPPGSAVTARPGSAPLALPGAAPSPLVDERWRWPIVLAAAAFGLLAGYLSGR